MFDSHLSIAGGLHRALLVAESYGMETVQIFTASPRTFGGNQSVVVLRTTKNQQQGMAITMLRPAGLVEVAGQRIDALSEADVIEPGTRIEVVRVSGLKVFVKAATIN